MASGPLVDNINFGFRVRITFLCALFFVAVWLLLLFEHERIFFAFDFIPAKLFLFFLTTLIAILIGIIIYAFFYIPPLKGYLIRLHGTFSSIAALALSFSVFGIPDIRRIEFTTSRVLFTFFEPKDPGPFLALTGTCVVGLIVTGLFYLVADVIDQHRA